MLCVIQDRTSRMLIGAGEQHGGLYYYYGSIMATAHQATCRSSLDLWHKRLGHPSTKVLNKLPHLSSNVSTFTESKVCDVCVRAKHSRTKFPISTNKALHSFDLAHCDLWGPYRASSSCGARYFLTILDDYSRAVWVYLLVDKKEVPTTLFNFFSRVKRQFNKSIKIVRSDNGTEFKPLQTFFLSEGIIF